MPIINKGIFTTGSAYLRQVGNDWPTAQVVYTADVLESSSNLYFTTARVASNVATLMKSFQGSGLTIDAANGQININTVASSIPELANVANTVISLAGHTTTEINEGSNLYYTDARVNVAVRPILTTANIIESSSNLYFTYARANAAIWPSLTAANIANFVSTVNSTVQPFLTTANVIETSGNLYFTNARVLSALSNATIQGNLYITQGNLYVTDSIFANNLILRGINATSNILSGGTVTASGFTGNTLTVDVVTSNTWNGLYTANVIETAGNLYYTDARVIAAVAPYLTTGNVIQTTQQYFTNARVLVAVTPLLTTANVIELASNLYYTDARVNVAIRPILTTANVIETAGNLYFTNSRVVSALVAGDNITIEGNGRISSSGAVSGVIVSDSIRIQSSGNATYGMGIPVTDPKRILVSIEGILQIPTVDYTVSGTDITFDTAIATGSNIEIKTFGQEYVNLSTTAALTSKVDNFIANSAITTYTLSLTPPSKDYISVVLNGNTLASTAYTLATNRVTLAFAPQTGANLDIRTIAGRSGSVFNTRKYTGNGISNTFVISAGFNNDTILVFENGISQFPVTDYNVVNENLVFVTPPAANVAIQIRELGVPVAVTAANALPAIRGYDQITGNLTPADPTKNLGNATVRWNTVYANSINISNTTIGVSSTGALTLTTSGTTTSVAGDSANYPHPFLLSLL
jgi:hypothetical protein